MKNLLVTIGCEVMLKKACELHREYQDLKRYKEAHAPEGH